MVKRIWNNGKTKIPGTNTRLENDTELGKSIAKVLTSLWNSQDNPGKVYVRGYRIHHGAIGFLGALASAYLKKPIAYGFFKHLADDDDQDAREWFAGERRR